MRVTALTGVPGTGKTSIASALAARGIGVVDLNEFARAKGLLVEKDAKRGSFIVDTQRIRKLVRDALKEIEGPIVLEGHFAHEMHVDAIVLLRCDPLVLYRRLQARGWKEEKVRENVEAEALDVLAAEVLDRRIPALELDVSTRSVEAAASAVSRIAVKGPKAFKGDRVGSAAWRVESLPWF